MEKCGKKDLRRYESNEKDLEEYNFTQEDLSKLVKVVIPYIPSALVKDYSTRQEAVKEYLKIIG